MKYGAFCLLICSSLAWTASQPKGGRYDQKILASAQHIVQSCRACSKVSVAVEDGVVTLGGTVELESTRQWLEGKMRRIAHAARVDDEIVLDPPAVSDQELATRLATRLVDEHFDSVTTIVHNGAVTLNGTVRDLEERERLLRIVQSTVGVKEVKTNLTIASNN
ncbi:MAG TPA: BON domain-containing protein [Alphaproteobacteria bacterium]|nr:BON domain-containing protein [Alphaproteobacteria bacterium]